MEIKLKRAYDAAEPEDGYRVLIDRLWPRGIKKEDLKMDEWAKDLAPSTPLRRFFHADQEGNWAEFAERYEAELRVSPATGNTVEKWKQQGLTTVTLLLGSSNAAHNHGVVLKRVLESYL